jgi:hypothetical protein
VVSTRRAASLRSGADPVHAFLDGYHTGLLVTIALMAAGVVVSYLTLRPRPAEITVSARLASEPAAVPADEGLAAGELALAPVVAEPAARRS